MNLKALISTCVLAACGAVGSIALPALAADSENLDWSAWDRLPVLDNARIMPLETFARTQVKAICGSEHPRLGMAGALSKVELASLTEAESKRLAEVSKTREFQAPELIFAWMTEPEQWNSMPFLYAPDETLRKEVLEVPIYGEDGERLKYVSPRQALGAKKFREHIQDLARQQDEARQSGAQFEPKGLDKKVRELFDSLTAYQQLTFDPKRSTDGTRWSMDGFMAMAEAWMRLQQDLARMPVPESHHEIVDLTDKTSQAVKELAMPLMHGDTGAHQPVMELEPLAAQVERLTSELAKQVADMADEPIAPNDALSKSQIEQVQSILRTFVSRTAEMARLAAQAHWSMFDPGVTVRVLPSLEPSALEADRFRSDIQPWISLQALDEGSAELLQGYPHDQVLRVRQAWNDARTAYRDHEAADRADRFASAMQRFSDGVRELGESVEPLRRELPIREKDKAILVKTAYPSIATINTEMFYNRFEPFFWSLALGSAAVVCLGLSFAFLPKPLFWLGLVVLLGAYASIIIGFALRVSITHWSPVTNMFETIVWVAQCVAILTIWATFLPLLGPSARAAWRMAAIPGTWEARPLREDERTAWPAGWRPATGATLLFARAMLFSGALYATGVIGQLAGFAGHVAGIQGSGESGYRLVSLWPRMDVGARLPTISALLVWAAGLFCVFVAIWFVPRLISAAVFAVPVAVYSVMKKGVASTLDQIYHRRIVTLAGAGVVCLAALSAYGAPFPKDIKALMPVLRSNVWLAIHVLTIVTSYSAAATAWGIGNFSLGFYLFGRYRPAEGSPSGVLASGGGPRRPPRLCGELSRLVYRVIQIAVLLLATGTILGGLWADVSWGRFWGWDPKEVWALIALMMYLIILHGRLAGWAGDITLTIGSVLGFTAVTWAWVGVNFLMAGGKHSYGTGEAGDWLQIIVLSALGINWVFVGLAYLRYKIETRRPSLSQAPSELDDVSTEL